MLKRLFIACFFSIIVVSCGSTYPNLKKNSAGEFISSYQTTYVWSWLGIHMMTTAGAVSGPRKLDAALEKASFHTSSQLRVVVFHASKAKVNAHAMAMLAQSAFDSVKRLAGAPPVDMISIYLIPSGYSYEHEHRSWSLGGKHSVDYVIPENYGTSYGHSVVREVSHELTHAWIGSRQVSQIANERAAVTMESCAILQAFGRVDEFNKHPLNEAEIGKLALHSSAAHFTLQAKYANDPDLDKLFSAGPILQGDPRAHALDQTCHDRALSAIGK